MSYMWDLRKKVGKIPLIMVTAAGIVVKDNKILLQKRSDLKVWAIHGGSMELGEALEDTMKREVFEEIGITPTDFSFFKTYSGKEFSITYPNGDMVYLVDNIYEVTAFDGHIIVDPNEVDEVKWFGFNEIPWNQLMSHNVVILKEYLLYKNVK